MINNNETEGFKPEKLNFGMKFEHLIASTIVSSNEVAALISGAFKNVFADVEGASVTVDNGFLGTDPIKTMIYFNYSPDAKTDGGLKIGTKRISDTEGSVETSSSVQRIRSFNAQFGSNGKAPRLFELTKEAKQLLYFYIPNQYIKGRKVNWELATEPTSQQSYYNPNQTPLLGVKIDLSKLLSAFFGESDETGDRFNYRSFVLNPITPYANNGQQMPINNVWNLLIMQLSTAQLNELTQKFGLVLNSNNLNIIR